MFESEGESYIEGIMEPKAPDLSWVGYLIGGAGLLVGWVIGVLRATWALSKFESRLINLEVQAVDVKEEILDGEVTSRLKALEAIAEKMGLIPDLVLDLRRTVSNIDKIIFQERGGLNVITLTEHEKLQAACQSMFRKDLEIIKTSMDQIVKNSGVDELRRIEIAIQRLENTFSSRVRTDKHQHVG